MVRREKDGARRRTKGKKRSSETEDHVKQRLATLKRLKRGDENELERLSLYIYIYIYIYNSLKSCVTRYYICHILLVTTLVEIQISFKNISASLQRPSSVIT